jgi:uncharacterized protein (TIGR00251 family)
VRLTPRGGRDSIEGWDGDVLRVRVRAAPVDGRANEALVRLLAAVLDVASSRVTIVAGASSRNKLVQIEGFADGDLRRRLSP